MFRQSIDADEIDEGNLGKTFDKEIEDGHRKSSLHECRLPLRPIWLCPAAALLPCLLRTSYHSLPQLQKGPRRNERSVGEAMRELWRAATLSHQPNLLWSDVIHACTTVDGDLLGHLYSARHAAGCDMLPLGGRKHRS